MSKDKNDKIKNLLDQYENNKQLFEILDELKLDESTMKQLLERAEILRKNTFADSNKLENLILNQSNVLDVAKKVVSANNLNEYLKGFDSISKQLEGLKQLSKLFPINISYEKGVSAFYKKAYEKIPKEANIKLEKIDSNKFQPAVELSSGIVYRLEDQPFVNSLQIFENISETDAAKFINDLERFPFFALKSKVGRIIFNELKKRSEEFSIIIPEGTLFYRGRPGKKAAMPFSFKEMFGPYYEKASIQRFSFFGNSCLYLGSSLAVVNAEFKRRKYVTKISLKNKSELHLLDYSDRMGAIFFLGMKEAKSKAVMPKEYLLPNFISQCCFYINETGDYHIDGIRYPSNKEKSGDSYVLFNQSMENFSNIKYVK